MKKRSFVQTFLILAVIIGFIVFIINNYSSFASLHFGNFIMIAPIILLYIAFLVSNGYVNRLMFKKMGANLKFNEWFGLSVLNSFGNLVLPLRGGLVSNAYYLKKKHNVSYSSYILYLYAIYIIVFFVNSVMGIICMIYFAQRYNQFSWPIFLFFVGVAVGLLIVIAITPQLKESKNRWLNKIVHVINNWKLIKNDLALVLKLATIAVINNGLAALLLYCEFKIIGVDIDFVGYLFLSVFASFSLLLSFTPGSLGIKELFSVFCATIIGVGSVQIVAASLIERLWTFVVLAILGSFYTYVLLKKGLQDTDSNKIN